MGLLRRSMIMATVVIVILLRLLALRILFIFHATILEPNFNLKSANFSFMEVSYQMLKSLYRYWSFSFCVGLTVFYQNYSCLSFLCKQNLMNRGAKKREVTYLSFG